MIVVGNTNLTWVHLKVQFEVIVISFVQSDLMFLTSKVTNLENVNY
jgi:hypothetical protein